MNMKWHLALRSRLGALDLDLEISGDATPVLLLGPNASGKTSLLRLIAGAYRPLSGLIQIGDQTLFDSRSQIDLPPEHRHVGYVPQGFQLFPHLCVADNVAFGLGIGPRKKKRSERRRAALAVLHDLGISQLADRLPAALSGGEQQRVALARALIVQPRMLLLDEPLSALDAASRRSIRSLLFARLAERALPAIVVTHDLRDVLALGGKVVVVEQGRIVQQGTSAELAAQPATDFVAEFFNSPAGA
jgi:molybdate transport system ATP-binding protein